MQNFPHKLWAFLSAIGRLTLLAIILACATADAADPLTFQYSGLVEKVVAPGLRDEPPINVPAVPVGSTFTGTFTFDPEAPKTELNPDYARFYDLGAASQLTLVINDLTFMTLAPAQKNPYLTVERVDNDRTRFYVSSQPMSLPPGWHSDHPETPYVTLYLLNTLAASEPLRVPTNTAGFDFSDTLLNWDSNEFIDIDGVSFNGRIAIRGRITEVVLVPESSTFVLGLIAAVSAIGLRCRCRA